MDQARRLCHARAGVVLNHLWIGFFVVALLAATAKAVATGDASLFNDLIQSVFSNSRSAFEIALGLCGTLAFWLGMLRIAERTGFIVALTRALTPLFRKLMPDVPDNHPALGAMVMNLAANMLGLDNAATPLGIKAMKELQSLNSNSETASNAQIFFVVLNASSVTLFPVTILTYRAQMGAASPADVFVPILLATSCSTLAGVLAVALIQRINVFDRVVLTYVGVAATAITLLVYLLFQGNVDRLQSRSSTLSSVALLLLIALILVTALFRRVNAYDAFIEGAKEGFQTAITIVPYLVAMLVGVGMLRSSGVLEAAISPLKKLSELVTHDTQFVDALPVALMKPFSGSGARALMLEAMKTFGVDSFVGRLSAVIQGSTETTFYVLAVYFGAVGVKNVRHALGCGLMADAAGVVASVIVARFFFAAT